MQHFHQEQHKQLETTIANTETQSLKKQLTKARLTDNAIPVKFAIGAQAADMPLQFDIKPNGNTAHAFGFMDERHSEERDAACDRDKTAVWFAVTYWQLRA